MPLLALDAALGTASAAVVHGGKILALETDHAGAARLAVLAEQVLRGAGLAGSDLEAVAASVGPGSFTGIRTALALAAGIGLAIAKPVIGVSVGEALAAILPASPPGTGARALWVAIDSKRGRIFLERAGAIAVFDMNSIPAPSGPVLLAGDAAGPVAEQLTRMGADVALANVMVPDAAALALAGVARLSARLPARAALPLYIDPPAARPSFGLRPDPQS